MPPPTTGYTPRLHWIYPPSRRRSTRGDTRRQKEGERRARHEFGADPLRQVGRAAERKRDADSEYEQAISRAGRLGLSHGEIAAAAHVSHSTIRAIFTRDTTTTDNGSAAEQQARDSEPDGIAA